MMDDIADSQYNKAGVFSLPSSSSTTTSNKQIYVALLSYHSTDDDEIVLEKGELYILLENLETDRVHVKRVNKDSRGSKYNDGKCPLNYLKLVKENS
jgi:hypothetical protein